MGGWAPLTTTEDLDEAGAEVRDVLVELNDHFEQGGVLPGRGQDGCNGWGTLAFTHTRRQAQRAKDEDATKRYHGRGANGGEGKVRTCMGVVVPYSPTATRSPPTHTAPQPPVLPAAGE